MLTQLFYRNKPIQGYFISDEGKIYDSNGVEQKQKLYPRCDYYYFKSHKVHQMMVHSFYGYKDGYDVHHKNQIKSDNRLQNLVYLTRQEHTKLHSIGNKNCLGKTLSDEHKEKIRATLQGKTRPDETKAKIRANIKKKQVYCLELDKVFAGVNIAAKELSLLQSHISLCCNGKRKTTGGYHFQFV